MHDALDPEEDKTPYPRPVSKPAEHNVDAMASFNAMLAEFSGKNANAGIIPDAAASKNEDLI